MASLSAGSAASSGRPIGDDVTRLGVFSHLLGMLLAAQMGDLIGGLHVLVTWLAIVHAGHDISARRVWVG